MDRNRKRFRPITKITEITTSATTLNVNLFGPLKTLMVDARALFGSFDATGKGKSLISSDIMPGVGIFW